MPQWVADMLGSNGNGAAQAAVNATASVPEIDASSGGLALAVIVASLFFVREMRQRAAI